MPETSQAAPPLRRLLGERLLDQKLVSADHLEVALQEQKATGALVGEILLQLGFVAPAALSAALAEQGGVPFLELAEVLIQAEALGRLPEAMARRLKVLPLSVAGQELRLAMVNIFDLGARTAVERHTGLRVAVVAASEEDLHGKTDLAYGERRTMDDFIEEAIGLAGGGQGAPELQRPIAGLVDQLLFKAIRDRATDVHIQPSERTVLTRYRVDGLLVQGPSLPKALQAAVLARLKVMAEVDIAEFRLPQDGKFRFPHLKRVYDVRASFLPAQHGEKVVLRLLDKSNLFLGLEQLHLPGPVLAGFSALLERPHGVLLLTGPTGSGKTTTLYSALNRLNASDRCIVTVEDPVEYELPLVTQVAQNLKAGLTFAAGLRAILRQDPDIILVGEIRDAETAAITLRAAMTGHLVLATLHANDPVGALPRLKDLGVSNLDLATALLGIHAQRLVRLNCPACARPADPPRKILARLQGEAPGCWMEGAGCPACGFTGIRGRRAIHDLLPVSPQVRDLIAEGARPAEVEALARSQGKGSLHEHAMALAREGLISLTEVMRVTAAVA